MDYVSRVVSNEHAKFRLSAPVRNQLKKKFKKKEEKKDKNVARSKIQKKKHFLCMNVN